MTERLTGKVAMITGAARGQGRSHALRLAEEGADLILVDICQNIDTLAYSLASEDDLAETVAQVEKLGRRVVAVQADTRDAEALRAAVERGTTELGSLDILVANAGVGMAHPSTSNEQAFRDQLEINTIGAWNTVHAAAPKMIEYDKGGVVVVISSVMGLSGKIGSPTGGAEGYVAAKHALLGLTRAWARWLGAHNIRVNSIHTTGVRTPMLINDAVKSVHVKPPTTGAEVGHILNVTMLDASDVSSAVAWLVSDEARYVTGIALPVDAGFSTP
ncbi:mycofactocin-coupled SDR family oxidoreductase [Streptantibioticus ferralitis]|uniref:Mycofactocin-coupled SDR family oxidoreductase n=1 Tax=Streptantibioticus ferralitis TaxID=236510 RepID=A0ABT5ZCE5_9ACTN|nr:mycofactocin-coupled SDR family oxidoreductase [Streptantibioticus ferralitis]MDF2261522.1 mycofactocin-coupled SDR family oxidoreductase [Streptantibioticus ferralitis]